MATSESLIDSTSFFAFSKDKAISNCSLEAKLALEDTGRFESLLIAHKTAWKHLWKYFDIDLKLTDLQKDYFVKRVLHLYAFHLLQTASIHSIDMDVGIPARGWHGEAYRGHIFWDEVEDYLTVSKVVFECSNSYSQKALEKKEILDNLKKELKYINTKKIKNCGKDYNKLIEMLCKVGYIKLELKKMRRDALLNGKSSEIIDNILNNCKEFDKIIEGLLNEL